MYIGKNDKDVSKDMTSHKIKNEIVEKEVLKTEVQPTSQIKIKTEIRTTSEVKTKAVPKIRLDDSNKDLQDLSYEDIRQDSSLDEEEKQRLIEQKVYFDSQNKGVDNSVVQKYTPEETEDLLKNNLLLHSTK